MRTRPMVPNPRSTMLEGSGIIVGENAIASSPATVGPTIVTTPVTVSIVRRLSELDGEPAVAASAAYHGPVLSNARAPSRPPVLETSGKVPVEAPVAGLMVLSRLKTPESASPADQRVPLGPNASPEPRVNDPKSPTTVAAPVPGGLRLHRPVFALATGASAG